MRPEVRISDQLAEDAARLIADAAEAGSHIALTGGSTPKAAYARAAGNGATRGAHHADPAGARRRQARRLHRQRRGEGGRRRARVRVESPDAGRAGVALAAERGARTPL